MEIKPNYVINESGQKIYAVIPIDIYNELIEKLTKEGKRIAELEDELDIKLASDVVNSGEEKIDFDIKNYV
ncbi:MAG: hypothetical protein FJW68_10245 [Actinobacteria bacterium]|nr:hypothetical protein [Actinomycetota bacterium]